jgi:hypothetical protein
VDYRIGCARKRNLSSAQFVRGATNIRQVAISIARVDYHIGYARVGVDEIAERLLEWSFAYNESR